MKRIEYDGLAHHPMSERLVDEIVRRTQSQERLYFRVLAAYFLSKAAASMRTMIATPEGNSVPINVFALALAPSGFGKGRAVTLFEKEVLDQFENRFLEETFPILAEDNLPKLANKRAIRKACDPDEELARVEKEFQKQGPYHFDFDSGSEPAVKQLRHKVLMANAGAMNLQIDEVGSHLSKNADMLDVFLELYDGEVKSKLTKQGTDNVRNEEIKGVTPTNMLLFGAPSRVLDGDKHEAMLMSMLETGYARRCLFAYVRTSRRKAQLTPQEALDQARQAANSTALNDISDHFMALADIINVGKTLVMPDESALLMYQYKMECEERAAALKEHQEAQRTEMEARFFKALKLAGVYAFVDDSPAITPDHYRAAIKLVEESGEALSQLLNREKPYEKLAKYIAEVGEDVTHADLVEDLPFYPKAVNQRNDMLTLAMAYGYKHNIVIKKSFQDGIEFLRGESLKETELDRMILSYSDDLAYHYQPEYAPFDQLHKLTQSQGLHWASHHVKDGHRCEENAIPGCNLLVIDVDGGADMDTVKKLLGDYKFFLYTTKRHTNQEHRFRLVFPMSHTLELDAKDYKEFYNNVRSWLPFETDDSCSHRAKKWLCHGGHHEYNDGVLFDVLPFIPKTSKNEERRAETDKLRNLDNLERWFINNTGDGNRNNQLHRYAMTLVDAGYDFNGVLDRVSALNNKLPDKLEEAEILGSIGKTVARALGTRGTV